MSGLVPLLKALLKSRHTGQIKGFQSRVGDPFQVAIKLDARNAVVLDFGE